MVIKFRLVVRCWYGPGGRNEASYLAMIGQTLGTLAAYQVTRGDIGETTTQTNTSRDVVFNQESLKFSVCLQVKL